MKVKCPHCGYENPVARKSWILKPLLKRGVPIKVTQYRCPRCLKAFRVGERA